MTKNKEPVNESWNFAIFLFLFVIGVSIMIGTFYFVNGAQKENSVITFCEKNGYTFSGYDKKMECAYCGKIVDGIIERRCFDVINFKPYWLERK